MMKRFNWAECSLKALTWFSLNWFQQNVKINKSSKLGLERGCGDHRRLSCLVGIYKLYFSSEYGEFRAKEHSSGTMWLRPDCRSLKICLLIIAMELGHLKHDFNQCPSNDGRYLMGNVSVYFNSEHAHIYTHISTQTLNTGLYMEVLMTLGL